MTLYVRNREELEHLIITMYSEGSSIRSLSRHFQMGRNTLRRILRKKDSERNEGHDILAQRQVPRQSKLNLFHLILLSLLSFTK